jgi:hypothetical protein
MIFSFCFHWHFVGCFAVFCFFYYVVICNSGFACMLNRIQSCPGPCKLEQVPEFCFSYHFSFLHGCIYFFLLLFMWTVKITRFQKGKNNCKFPYWSRSLRWKNWIKYCFTRFETDDSIYGLWFNWWTSLKLISFYRFYRFWTT